MKKHNLTFSNSKYLPAVVLSTAIWIVSCVFAQPILAQTVSKQSAYYQFLLGDIQITAVSDGTVDRPMDKILKNAKPGEIEKGLSSVYLKEPVELSVNTYLFKINGKLILIDTGAGELFGPTVGHLAENLKAIGYDPSQIDVILLTHIHGDHSGGLTVNKKRVFPNADVYVNQKDADYFLSEANLNKAAPDRKTTFVASMATVNPYKEAGKLKTFNSDTTLFDVIKTVAAPGHTPGHTFYVLENQGQKIVFSGDIIHLAAVQFSDPSVTIEYDVYPDLAAKSRKDALEKAAKEGYWIAGDHISFPGIGHVGKNASGYVWVPVNYSIKGF
jgi:glyoxylase-like metal-dependent hydrolase (beta-lactamase superfamily II)